MERQAHIERKALLIGASVYLIMGIYGWFTFYLSHSDAMLLDGNYNMVNAIASFIGYYVVKIRHRKTDTFPWGQFIYESTYALIKGILILGILTAALWENSLKIYDYFSKGRIHEVNTGPIVYMVLLSVMLCFGLAFYYKYANQKTGGRSTMLITDTKAALIDGYLSLFGGGSLLLMIYIGKTVPNLAFLQYIGDAMVVLIFEAVMIREPFHIIKQNFIELAGGQLQSDKEWDNIYSIVESVSANGLEIDKVHITKTGSLYLVLVYMHSEAGDTALDAVINYKVRIEQSLQQHYQNLTVEMIIK